MMGITQRNVMQRGRMWHDDVDVVYLLHRTRMLWALHSRTCSRRVHSLLQGVVMRFFPNYLL